MKKYCMVLVVLAAPFGITQAQPPLAANAALKYWQAFEQMPKLDADQEKLLENWNAVPLDAAALKVIGAADKSLLYLHRGAALPRSDWGLDYEDGPHLLLPQLQKARTMARLACLRSRHNFEQGKVQAGVDDALAAMTMARHLASDVTLISILVNYSIDHVVLDALGPNLPRLNAAQLTALGARVAALPAASKPQESILFEKEYMLNWLIKRLKKQPGKSWQKEFAPVLESEKQLQDFVKELGDVSNEKVIQLLEELGPFYDEMAKLLAEDRRGFQPRWEALRKKWSVNPFDKLLSPALDKVVDAENRDSTRLALLKAALVVVKEGPKSIKNSRDPFGDGPFELQTLPVGFELRSKLIFRAQPVSLVVGAAKKP